MSRVSDLLLYTLYDLSERTINKAVSEADVRKRAGLSRDDHEATLMELKVKGLVNVPNTPAGHQPDSRHISVSKAGEDYLLANIPMPKL